jgi:hypothetical protein
MTRVGSGVDDGVFNLVGETVGSVVSGRGLGGA